MIKTVKAGKHRGKPRSFGLYWNKKVFRKTITFHSDCRYMIDAEHDINKLWGVGYGLNHHQDSARFGWRYNPTNDKIEILAYCYVDWARIFKHITFVDIGKEYDYIIMTGGRSYRFIVDAAYVTQPYRHKKKLGFALGFWFGGQATAPHKMTIEIK